MNDEEIYKLIKSKEYAIKENLLLKAELLEIEKSIKDFLDKNLKEDSIIFLRYRKLKKTLRTLWSDDRGYPVEGYKYIEPLVDIFEQYLATKKIKRRLENEKLWIQSNIQGNEEHIFVGERKDEGKVHLIIGETGEVRIDKKDNAPHELVRKVETILTLKSGEKIISTKTALEFLES
jgi:hypothetical protein